MENAEDCNDSAEVCADSAEDCNDSAEGLRQERRRVAFLKKRLTPRSRELFNGLVRRIGRGRIDIIVEAHCLKVAELQAGCEDLRLRMATAEPDAVLVNSITRLESTTARAERALFKAVPPKTAVHIPLREQIIRKRQKPGKPHEKAKATSRDGPDVA
jgi:hypothetical protein